MSEEKPALRPAPTRPYDIPQRSEPKVGRDQHVQVLRALYSVPKEFEGKRLIDRPCDEVSIEAVGDELLAP